MAFAEATAAREDLRTLEVRLSPLTTEPHVLEVVRARAGSEEAAPGLHAIPLGGGAGGGAGADKAEDAAADEAADEAVAPRPGADDQAVQRLRRIFEMGAGEVSDESAEGERETPPLASDDDIERLKRMFGDDGSNNLSL